MNAGKKFERDFKKSVPDNVFYYRFIDGTASWAGSKETSFQRRNICDCMIYDSNVGLLLLELKSCSGASLPFKNIRDKQIDDMLAAREKRCVFPYIIINMRKHEKTFALPVFDAYNYMETADRKSFPLEFLEKSAVRIWQKKLRVNYRYDINEFLAEIKWR